MTRDAPAAQLKAEAKALNRERNALKLQLAQLLQDGQERKEHR